jgi:FAD/FMN-containing dehydrogenase
MSTVATAAGRQGAAIQRLVRILGEQHVLLADADLRFFGQDVHHAGRAPLAVIRPGSVDELAACVAVAAAAHVALLPRGGGMSYTQGYLAAGGDAVTVDTTRLDRIVEINADDGYVTVECGATWKQLDDALAPFGVRTPFWGTLSGLRATVGGGLSQGAIFLGSGKHGAAAESLLGLDVVLGDGTVARVGSHANLNGKPFYRQFGPDLSAAFTGDCGALGIKARATLRLVPRFAETRFLSYAFPDAPALFACMAEIARAGVVSELFAFDPGMQKVRMRRVSVAEDARALGQVMKSAGGGLKALREGARVVLAGRGFLDEADFSLHMSVDGRDAADADARAGLVRRIVGERGSEVAATIPRVMRSNPFAEVNSMIGPGGERWVPVHGSVPLTAAPAMFQALESVFGRYREQRERLEISHGYLLCTVGDRALLIEPVLYWPDARLLFHDRVLEPDYLAKLPQFQENLPARRAVDEIRGALARCFMEHGAVSFQLGRFYLYQEGLDPTAAALLAGFKRLVDPAGVMNPGCLGLG